MLKYLLSCSNTTLKGLTNIEECYLYAYRLKHHIRLHYWISGLPIQRSLICLVQLMHQSPLHHGLLLLVGLRKYNSKIPLVYYTIIYQIWIDIIHVYTIIYDMIGYSYIIWYDIFLNSHHLHFTKPPHCSNVGQLMMDSIILFPANLVQMT